MHTAQKILTIVALAALATACQQQTDIKVADSDYIQVPITLNVTVKPGLNMSSRSMGTYESIYNKVPRRPVTWDGQQSITDMRVYVFSSDKPDGRYLYDGGGNCLDDGAYRVVEFYNPSPWTNTDNESHVYMFTPRMQKGRYYKFLAVGRDDADGKEIPDRFISFIPWGTRTMSGVEMQIGVTEFHEAGISNMLLETHYPYFTTEIFSGMMQYRDANGELAEDYVYIDDAKTGFQKTIELKRSVAGIWVYVTDIPTKVVDNSGRPGYNGTEFSPNELTLYMTKASNKVNLASYSDAEESSYHESVQVGYVDLQNVYGEIDMKNWYSTGSSPYWLRGRIDNYRGISIGENCALMTNYILPINLDDKLSEDETTFTLELRENENRFRLTRRVRCHITSITDPITGKVTPYNGEPYRFPIIANSLYTIGTPDEPFSLKGMSSRADDDIVMEINPY